MDDRMHIGKAAEHRLISELLIRGLEPLLVIVDKGHDLVLTNGLKIQVKAARQGNTSRQHAWKIVQYRYQKGVSIEVVKPIRLPDFYALWLVEADRWFIVPVSETVGKHVMYLQKMTRKSPVSTKSLIINSYEAKWNLLKI